jgi:hypothetical protein
METLQNIFFRNVTYANTRRHIPRYSTADFRKYSYAKPRKKWEDNIKIDLWPSIQRAVAGRDSRLRIYSIIGL